MASYYKTIDGENYDKAILDMAEACVAGKGDGRISVNDARKIVRLMQDGGKVTDIEKRSLQYILKKDKFTDAAQKHIKNALGGTAAVKGTKKPKAAERKTAGDKKNLADAAVKSEPVDKVHAKDQAGAKAKKKCGLCKILLILLLLILLLLGIYYLYMKYKNRGGDQVPGTAVQSDSSMNVADEQNSAGEPEPVSAEKIAEETGSAESTDGKIRYVIKEGDTLVKISTAHYNDYRKWRLIWDNNKGVLKSPTLIFPGQVIVLPEDK